MLARSDRFPEMTDQDFNEISPELSISIDDSNQNNLLFRLVREFFSVECSHCPQTASETKVSVSELGYTPWLQTWKTSWASLLALKEAKGDQRYTNGLALRCIQFLSDPVYGRAYCHQTIL